MFNQKCIIKISVFALIAIALSTSAAFAADGWAGEAGGTTGGAGGTEVTVNNATDFINYVQNTKQTPYIIYVSGNINLGSSNVRVRGNKTIIGLPGSHLTGNMKCFKSIESNNIFQNLDMDNYNKVGDGDCITIDDADHIWIDHCTFTDGGDGNVDIKNSADYVTVSWCIFKYTRDSGHNFSNLVGHDDGNGGTDRDHLLVTFHHNWWSTMTKERMPRVRFGKVHVYNNYYSDLLAGGYCIGVGTEANIRVESNYFNAVPNPWKNYYGSYTAGKIGWDTDNVFYNCTVPTWAPNNYSTVFVPPYSYTTDDGLSVPGIVMAGAGAGGSTPPQNNPPTVSITSPANGATFTAPASITINATAADSDGTVTKVDFYQGSTLLGTDTTSPYSYTWTNVAAGSYSLTAKATDNGGAATTSSAVNITVTGSGNNPPTVSITSPANGATFTAPASITINATASDSDGTVSKVDFYQGSTLLGTDTSSPYSYTWSNAAAGSYSLTAKATDNGGATKTSSAVNITVNPAANNPPTVSITSPANGATFTAPASITINATASDSDGTVSKVDFYQGSTLLGTDTSSPYSYTWSNAAAGSYSLTAKATDNGGATKTSSAVNITVNPAANNPPTVSITSPANGATFTAPASITINATASDSDGTVSKVDFYQGSTLLGTDTSSPYSYTWSNVSAGSYSLTAKATDNGGAVTTSSAVNITVSSGGGTTVYQAEDYTSQSGCSLATEHAGYTGTGFMDYGTYVEWNNVDGGSGGSCTLTFRYANGSTGNRSCTLMVNGSNVGTATFAPTGSWSTWNDESVTATLNAGNNTIRVTRVSNGPNLDKMTVVTP